MLTSDLFENKTPAAWRAGYERGLKYYLRGPTNPYKSGTEEYKDFDDGYHHGELDGREKYNSRTDEGATDDPRFQKMMGNIQKNTPDPVSGYVAVNYSSEQPSKKIRGVSVNGKSMPTTINNPDQLMKDLKFTSDQIEQRLMAIGQKYGWNSIDPGHGPGYDELFFDTNKEYTSLTQHQLAANIVKTVNEINKFFSGMNSSLQATGLPGYKARVWQGMGTNDNINQFNELNQIANIAKGKSAKSDPGPAIGKMILKYILGPEHQAENDELGFDPEDFANATAIAKVYIAQGEEAGLRAQLRAQYHVSEMIDEILSDAGVSNIRTMSSDDLAEGGLRKFDHKRNRFKSLHKLQSPLEESPLHEFAPGSGGDDNIGDDPYKYPTPKRYNRSADYFEQFEADHFDREDFDDDTGVFKGYWDNKQIAYFKFDNPARTGGNNPGMGWYYEPKSSGRSDNTAAPAADDSAQRKQQELSMIRAFLKSGNRPNPDSQIGRLMKKHGMTEGSDDTVRFEVDSENAYNHVMDQFGSVIDWDGDTMVAPRKYWGAIQELALAVSGEASEEQGVAEADDSKFVGFMNKTMSDKVDAPKADTLAGAPAFYRNAAVSTLDARQGFKNALKFGLKALSRLDSETRQQLAAGSEQEVEEYLTDVAERSGQMGDDTFVEEDISEVQDYLSDVFHDPSINSWKDVLQQSRGVEEGVVDTLKGAWEKIKDFDNPARQKNNQELRKKQQLRRKEIKNQDVVEELSMKHQRDHKTQKYADRSNSLAQRSFSMAQVPNVTKSADGHPTVKYRTDITGKAGATRVDPTITPTTVKRKNSDKPIPAFLKKQEVMVDEQQLTEQDLAEAVSTLELADFLFKGLEQKFPKIIERYGHEVVGNAIMDVAEENLDVSSVSEVDMLIDDIIEKLQNYNSNDSGLTESTVSRLYYNVVGTSAPELRKDFGMRHDRRGWFLSESSGRNRIMDAQRAFGSPKLVEYSISDATGGAAQLGPDNVISPVGSVPKSQRINTKKARK